jgi:pilus assembly protein CpaE
MSAAPIKTLVAVDADVDLPTVQSVLPVDGPVQVVSLVHGLEESWTTLQEIPSDALVVACAGYSERALYLVDGAVRQQPDRPVVVLSMTSHPNGFVRRVFEAGADDIVDRPTTADEVRFTVEKAVARKRGKTAGSGIATGSLIAVLGPKGGTGKTMSSCNLAIGLAARGQRVAIVDLDLQFGDVGLSLGLVPERTIYDLAKAGGSIDAEKVEGFLAMHPSGVRVLQAPARPDHAGAVGTEFLREVYAALRTTYDFVVVDTPPGFPPEVIATVDSASQVVLVGMLDALSLKNAKLGLETLELMGYERERIRILLNRSDSRVGISHADVEAILGGRPDVAVPSDRDVPRLVNQGTALIEGKPRSDGARAYRRLAELVSVAGTGQVSRPRRFGRRNG